LGVPEHDVTALWLEVPRSDQDCIAHLDPDTAFHFSPNSTHSGDAVRAFDQYSVIAQEILDGPVELAWTRCEHLAEVGLAEDLSLTHTIILLERSGNIKGQNGES